MAKNLPTLTEFIDEYPDVHNVREWIHDLPRNYDKIREIFARHRADLLEERECYEVYALGLVSEARSSGEQRLDTSQKQRQAIITFYELLIEKLKPLAEDPYFCSILDLKHNEVKARLERVETVLATFLEYNQRAGQIKSIKYWLRYLLPYLHNSELSETKRVNLIYDLFVEFDVPLAKQVGIKGRIKKWDEEILRAQKNSPSR